MDDYLEAMKEEMAEALTALKGELAKVRTGRASPKLLDRVQCDVASYGAVMPLNQLATVQAPDARLLVVTPWDKSTINDVMKGIVAAGLGLNPSTDGQVVRVPVPPLTAQRRQDLVKLVKKAGEDSKIRIRRVRKEYNDTFKEAEKDGDLSEDQLHRMLDKVQQATDSYVVKVDEALAAKEAEVLEV